MGGSPLASTPVSAIETELLDIMDPLSRFGHFIDQKTWDFYSDRNGSNGRRDHDPRIESQRACSYRLRGSVGAASPGSTVRCRSSRWRIQLTLCTRSPVSSARWKRETRRPRRSSFHRLEQEDPRAAALVKLRVFAGLTQEAAAAALGVVRRTADRDWAFARAWLFQRLSDNSCRTADTDGA